MDVLVSCVQKIKHGPEGPHVYEPQAMWTEQWIVVSSSKLGSPNNLITQKDILLFAINQLLRRKVARKIYGKIGQCTVHC